MDPQWYKKFASMRVLSHGHGSVIDSWSFLMMRWLIVAGGMVVSAALILVAAVPYSQPEWKRRIGRCFCEVCCGAVWW
jgi:hypothetical protein